MGNNLSESGPRSSPQADDHMDFEEITAPGDCFSEPEAQQLREPTIEPAESVSDNGGIDDEEDLGFVPVDLESIKIADAKEHGPRPLDDSTDAWKWSDRFRDFIQREEHGNLLRYTVYQRPGEELDLPDPNEASDLSSQFGNEPDYSESEPSPDGARSNRSVVSGRGRQRRSARKRKRKPSKPQPGCGSNTSSIDLSGANISEQRPAQRESLAKTSQPLRSHLPFSEPPPAVPVVEEAPRRGASRGRPLQRPPAERQASSPRRNDTPPSRPSSSESDVPPQRPTPPLPFLSPDPVPYRMPLDAEFKVVTQPRRFFHIGRIFMTVWFEAESRAPSRTLSSTEWHNACPPFREIRPYAAFRWFIVVRKKTTHSLCFSITTQPAAPSYAPRGGDYCVLHSALIGPPQPSRHERTLPDPVAVIVEHKGKFISPMARVDLSRVYTVEHNLKVMKLGRVHPDSLPTLEAHYKRAVA